MGIFITALVTDLGYNFGANDPAHWVGPCKISTSDPLHPTGPNIPDDILSNSEHEAIFVKKPTDLKRYGMTHNAAVALKKAGTSPEDVQNADLDIASVQAFKLGQRSFVGALLILREEVYDTLDQLLRTLPRGNMAVMLAIDFTGFSSMARHSNESLSVEQFRDGGALVKATKFSLKVGPVRELPLNNAHGTEMEPGTPTRRF